jgi:hypothetical protein
MGLEDAANSPTQAILLDLYVYTLQFGLVRDAIVVGVAGQCATIF